MTECKKQFQTGLGSLVECVRAEGHSGAHSHIVGLFNDEDEQYRNDAQLMDEKLLADVKPDMVNHPPHYNAYKGIEIIELTRQMNFNRGNAVKYTTRAGLKPGVDPIEDLKKAIWYLTDEIKRLEEDASDNKEN